MVSHSDLSPFVGLLKLQLERSLLASYRNSYSVYNGNDADNFPNVHEMMSMSRLVEFFYSNGVVSGVSLTSLSKPVLGNFCYVISHAQRVLANLPPQSELALIDLSWLRMQLDCAYSQFFPEICDPRANCAVFCFSLRGIVQASLMVEKLVSMFKRMNRWSVELMAACDKKFLSNSAYWQSHLFGDISTCSPTAVSRNLLIEYTSFWGCLESLRSELGVCPHIAREEVKRTKHEGLRPRELCCHLHVTVKHVNKVIRPHQEHGNKAH